MGSSPLTRGKRVLEVRRAGAVGLIPAHAGKTSPARRGHGTAWAHPRSRGENLAQLSPAVASQGSSPLTRGKRPPCPQALCRPGLIPAHAGKTVRYPGNAPATWAHPRSRGENSQACGRPSAAAGSSPLTRGKRLTGVPEGRAEGLIPAHAGKTTFQALLTRTTGAHPRSRGENDFFAVDLGGAAGSSPLTRGKLKFGWSNSNGTGLIPAHAGKTL